MYTTQQTRHCFEHTLDTSNTFLLGALGAVADAWRPSDEIMDSERLGPGGG